MHSLRQLISQRLQWTQSSACATTGLLPASSQRSTFTKQAFTQALHPSHLSVSMLMAFIAPLA